MLIQYFIPQINFLKPGILTQAKKLSNYLKFEIH